MISKNSPAYRPDIDGLRAIAVLAVIAFHASSGLAPGGFVGVDIFFVISGYLISNLIFKDLEKGRFRFSDFYTRRIKRLLPAYIIVSLFTLAVSTYLLIPNDYIFYTTSLAASWGFASNVFFSMLSWGYFGQRTEEFPLLHTWSLSVEEQFYFVFPILLIVLFRFCKRQVIPVLVAFGLVFVYLSEIKAGKVGAYFLLPYRAHELIIGVVTMLVLTQFPLRNRWVSTILAGLGMAMMAGSIFLLQKTAVFPGFNSLFPCIGAALLIYACSVDNPVGRILRNKALVFVGLISYSLYLWHWPIFSFLRYRQIELTFAVGTGAIAAAFILSYLTWKLVEVPIRTNRTIEFKGALLRFYAAPAVVFLCIGAVSYFTEGAPQRFSDDFRQLISSYSFERDLTKSCSIRSGEYSGISLPYLLDHCAFGDLERDKADVLLFGDSHANHFKPFVEELSKRANLKSVYFVEGSCEAIDLPDGPPADGEPLSTCQRRNADLLQMAGKFKFVVLASFWSYKGKEDLFERRLGTAVQRIIAAGATPVIFKDNPHFEPDISQCVLFKKRGWVDANRNCNIPYSFVRETQDTMNEVIDATKLKYPGTIVIDPKVVMCNAVECTTSIGNIALYKDANHINTKAAVVLAERYLSVRGNPFTS